MFDTFNSTLSHKRNKAKARAQQEAEDDDAARAANSALDDTGDDNDHDTSKPKHLYHGHRRASWTTDDIDELTELRARQRTFEGAYQRTALGMATYAIVVLKIFSPAFAKIGVCYIAMAALMLIVSYLRKRRSDHDFADAYRVPPQEADSQNPVLRPGKRAWGRQFRTVGNLVIFLSLCVIGLEVGIFTLLMRL